MGDLSDPRIKEDFIFGIFFNLPETTAKKIFELKKQIESVCHSTYQDYKKETDFTDIHTAIVRSVVPAKNKELLQVKLKTVLATEPQFDLEISGFEVKNVPNSNNSYIFLDYSESSQQKLQQLREVLQSAVNEIRNGYIADEDKSNWDSYVDFQKESIINTGFKYPFEPHLSLAKIPSNEVNLALPMLKKENLILDFPVDKLFLLGGKKSGEIWMGKTTFLLK